MIRGPQKVPMDIDSPDRSTGSSYWSQQNGLNLYPVSVNDSGEGLPYAPENFPNPGDMWGWKVGRRLAPDGYFLDRYMYPPTGLPRPGRKTTFSSRLSLERYIRANFPDADINAFFASFSWKIPYKKGNESPMDFSAGEGSDPQGVGNSGNYGAMEDESHEPAAGKKSRDRAVDIETCVSLVTMKELDTMFRNFSGVDLVVCHPRRGLIQCPPSGYVTLYMDYFKSGFTLPYHPLFGEVLMHYKVSLGQLTPNCFPNFKGFLQRFEELGLEANLEAFQALFMVKQSLPGPYVFFFPRPPGHFLNGNISSRGPWKTKFFYFPIDQLGIACPEGWCTEVPPKPITSSLKRLRKKFEEAGLFASKFDISQFYVRGELVLPRLSMRAPVRSLAVQGTGVGTSRDARRRPLDVPRSAFPLVDEPRDTGKRAAASTPLKEEPFADDDGFDDLLASMKDHDGECAAQDAPREAARVERPAGVTLYSDPLVPPLKRPREHFQRSSGASGHGKKLFSYGVNRDPNVQSFWDAHDITTPCTRVADSSDYDSARLSVLPPQGIDEQVRAHAGQLVQLSSQFRQTCEEMAKEKEDLMRKVEEVTRRAEESEKKHQAALKDLEAEVSFGQGFLNSEAGKKVIKDAGRSAVEKFRRGADFAGECNRKAKEKAKEYILVTIRRFRKFIRSSGHYPLDDFTWVFPEVKDDNGARTVGPSGPHGGSHVGS